MSTIDEITLILDPNILESRIYYLRFASYLGGWEFSVLDRKFVTVQ